MVLQKKKRREKGKQCIPETLQKINRRESSAGYWRESRGRVEAGLLKLLLQDNLTKEENKKIAPGISRSINKNENANISESSLCISHCPNI